MNRYFFIQKMTTLLLISTHNRYTISTRTSTHVTRDSSFKTLVCICICIHYGHASVEIFLHIIIIQSDSITDRLKEAEEYASKKRLVAPVHFDQNDVAKKFEHNLNVDAPVDFIDLSSSSENSSRASIENDGNNSRNDTADTFERTETESNDGQQSGDEVETSGANNTDVVGYVTADTFDQSDIHSDDDQQSACRRSLTEESV